MGDAARMRQMPRAEPDQVVRAAARFDDGRFAGRYEGAITAGMVQKRDVRHPAPNDDHEPPTNEGSVWQMDLMDMSTRQAEQGFALVAVDVNSRYLVGALTRDKTFPSLLRAFDEILRIRGADMANKTALGYGAPHTIDTDRERAWSTPEWAAEMQRRLSGDKHAGSPTIRCDYHSYCVKRAQRM